MVYISLPRPCNTAFCVQFLQTCMNECIFKGGKRTYPRGVHTRKKRSSAIAIRHKTETRVNVMTTQLRNRQPWTEVSARPSTATADGMATQPTKKSATAKETIRHMVGCLRVLGDQRAKMTNMLPRQQKTAVSTSKVV